MLDQEWKSQNPITLFGTWLDEAKQNSNVREPTAMALATLSKKHGLSNRVVLLKGFSENGFSFFTNYNSRKGKELLENPNAAAVFYWDPLAKQIRITGPVRKTSAAESDAYWVTRSRDSQLSQYISRQSEVCGSREELEKQVREADAKLKGGEVPRPVGWGGYILEPLEIEFWESRPGRLHDRFLFTKEQDHWTINRLYP